MQAADTDDAASGSLDSYVSEAGGVQVKGAGEDAALDGKDEGVVLDRGAQEILDKDGADVAAHLVQGGLEHRGALPVRQAADTKGDLELAAVERPWAAADMDSGLGGAVDVLEKAVQGVAAAGKDAEDGGVEDAVEDARVPQGLDSWVWLQGFLVDVAKAASGAAGCWAAHSTCFRCPRLQLPVRRESRIPLDAGIRFELSREEAFTFLREIP